MVREDLITSAVSFLQDPSVASAPLDKRIAFLQSKNLSQEEIDLSLSRASDISVPPSQPNSFAYRTSPSSSPGYGSYSSHWLQQPPPEVPRRDWRDWFIMATVLGGVSYGLYFTAKRYIYPLIAPPTPPQLEQDKASVDEAFNRAFTLLEQLNSDTASLKASEEARTQRLDSALVEVEGVIASLKDSSKRRDDDSRRIEDDVRGLRELIPKALEAHKETTAAQLKDLGNELKSLKTLVANRMSATPGPTPSRPNSSTYGQQTASTTNGSSVPATSTPAVAPPSGGGNGVIGSSSAASTVTSDKAQASSAYGRFGNGRASIPSWQMAAAKKDQGEEQDMTDSGTVTGAGVGAS